MQALEVNVNEPMQEYVQYAAIIKSILKFRHQKHIQSESTADLLEAKRSSLENLERMETEAKRIEDALKRERSVTGGSSSVSTPPAPSTVQEEITPSGGDDNHSITEEGTFTNEPESSTLNGDAAESEPYNPYARTSSTSSTTTPTDATSNPYAQLPPSNNPYAHTHAPPSGVAKRRSTRLNVFSALSHTLHGIIDVDPEATRRNNIGKTRDAIVQVKRTRDGP